MKWWEYFFNPLGITVEYEEAVDDNPASLQVSILFKNDKQPQVSRSSSPTKEEGKG